MVCAGLLSVCSFNLCVLHCYWEMGLTVSTVGAMVPSKASNHNREDGKVCAGIRSSEDWAWEVGRQATTRKICVTANRPSPPSCLDCSYQVEFIQSSPLLWLQQAGPFPGQTGWHLDCPQSAPQVKCWVSSLLPTHQIQNFHDVLNE